MNTRSTIVIIMNRFAVGGAERLVVDSVHEMIARGMDVRVVTLRPEHEISLRHELNLASERCVCIPFRNHYDFGAYTRLIRWLLQARPRVVMTHLWFANAIGRIAAYLARTPVIITFEHNVYDAVKTKTQFLFDRMLQRLSTRIIAVSSAVKTSLVAHGIRENRIVVIENGIDFGRFTQTSHGRGTARTSLGITGDQTVFLFVGRLVAQKGCNVLLRALAMLDTGILIVAGDGPDAQDLHTQATRLSLNERVSFLGSRNDAPLLFAAADCFVLPSRWEGFGIVVLEAMASHVPVIASDVEPVRMMVRHGESGLIVPIGDPAALANAMLRVQQEPPLLEHLRAGGHENIQRFSIQNHVDTLLSYAH